MSELKAFNIPRYAGQFAIHEVYFKSEADKVIAELKAQFHDYAQGMYVMQAMAENETRHHKYKRCLNNAWWCRKSSNAYAWSASNLRGWKIAEYYDKKRNFIVSGTSVGWNLPRNSRRRSD